MSRTDYPLARRERLPARLRPVGDIEIPALSRGNLMTGQCPDEGRDLR
jgi:hypothetical protein